MCLYLSSDIGAKCSQLADASLMDVLNSLLRWRPLKDRLSPLMRSVHSSAFGKQLENVRTSLQDASRVGFLADGCSHRDYPRLTKQRAHVYERVHAHFQLSRRSHIPEGRFRLDFLECQFRYFLQQTSY